MRKAINIACITFITCLASFAAPHTIKGRVCCDGKGIEGVVVSDGIEVTTTNRSGRYSLNSLKENGYVFISIPSGYEVEADGLLPRFYKHLEGKKIDIADFHLHRVDQSRYSVFVTADIHLTGDLVDKDLPEFHKSFLPGICEAINETEGPVYSISLGDMTTDGKWYKNNFAFQEYLREMADYPTPIFHIMGNHDNDQRGEGTFEQWESIAEERYKREIGPNYYSINIGSYHYLMLDDIITTGPKKKGNPAETYVGKYGFTYGIDAQQMEWIAKDLSYVPKQMGLVICMHVPFYLISGLTSDKIQYTYAGAASFNPDTLTALIKDFRDIQFITGHYHHTEVIPLAENITQHIQCSASAVSWKINDIDAPMVCDDGTPAGCQIYKVNGNDISWYYKSNYCSVDKSQCNVYDLNTTPIEYGGKPESNEVLINIFNWDPMWKVQAFDNGKEIDVKQIYGFDPMYLQIRNETKTLLKRPTAFRETQTLHLFTCKRSCADSDLKIIITDRFGNTYEARPGQTAVEN